jgi:hypothetical protein
MTSRIYLGLGLVVSFGVGFLVARFIEPPDGVTQASVSDEPPGTDEPLAVLREAFPSAFPEDIKLQMGRAYGPKAMRLFVTTQNDFLAAVAQCRRHLPGDWVEVPVDNESIAFASALRGTRQTSVLIRNQRPVRYEISTEGAVFAKARRLQQLNGKDVPKDDLEKYLIRLQASQH